MLFISDLTNVWPYGAARRVKAKKLLNRSLFVALFNLISGTQLQRHLSARVTTHGLLPVEYNYVHTMYVYLYSKSLNNTDLNSRDLHRFKKKSQFLKNSTSKTLIHHKDLNNPVLFDTTRKMFLKPKIILCKDLL